MDAGISLVLALIAFVSFGLIYFRVRDAASDLWRAYGPHEPSIVSEDTAPEITSSRADAARVVRTWDAAPSDALDGRSDAPPAASSDDAPWEPEEVLRQLATIKIRRKDGTIGYLSKERMAALVGMRAEEARAIVNAERGEPPPDGLRVKDSQGERVISRVA